MLVGLARTQPYDEFMTRARSHIVCLEETPYYHVTARCVRRAFLCGVDSHTGRSYEHRRGWIEDRIRVLSSLFSVEICAYAVMSNHYHLVLKLNPNQSLAWSDDEVLNRWTALFRGPLLVQRHLSGDSLSAVESDALKEIANVYRTRLGSLSWFMKCLNEPIARQANAEDGCTGHFWEARFHSQPLKSERALLTVMAYVDLNPIRAGIAKKPEESDYTSIKTRLAGDDVQAVAASLQAMLDRGEIRHAYVSLRLLMPFSDNASRASAPNVLPMQQLEYFKLVDTTGRILTTGKRGGIDPLLEPIIERLGLSEQQWVAICCDFKKYLRKGELHLTKAA